MSQLLMNHGEPILNRTYFAKATKVKSSQRTQGSPRISRMSTNDLLLNHGGTRLRQRLRRGRPETRREEWGRRATPPREIGVAGTSKEDCTGKLAFVRRTRHYGAPQHVCRCSHFCLSRAFHARSTALRFSHSWLFVFIRGSVVVLRACPVE